MRKRYSGEFKAKVAIEALKGDRSLSELSSKYEVHPNQIRLWKKIIQTRYDCGRRSSLRACQRFFQTGESENAITMKN